MMPPLRLRPRQRSRRRRRWCVCTPFPRPPASTTAASSAAPASPTTPSAPTSPAATTAPRWPPSPSSRTAASSSTASLLALCTLKPTTAPCTHHNPPVRADGRRYDAALRPRSPNLPSPPSTPTLSAAATTVLTEVAALNVRICGIACTDSRQEELIGFITGTRKATELAHSAWKRIIRQGDVVVDATCGNGYDTMALLKMVADKSGRGCVFGMDIQKSALQNTSSLLEQSVDENERKQVQLFLHCHSKMEDIIPKDIPVRLIAFNLGYLPGGDKAIITASQTTLLALQASSRLLMSGGLISLVVYVGHPGGRNELETVQNFTSSLPTESWVCCKFEILNRPTGPILVLLHKK